MDDKQLLFLIDELNILFLVGLKTEYVYGDCIHYFPGLSQQPGFLLLHSPLLGRHVSLGGFQFRRHFSFMTSIIGSFVC